MSRPTRRVLLFAFFLSLSINVWAQTLASPQPVRDPAAVIAVQNAIAAMGGANAVSQISNCLAQGSIQATPGGWMTSGSFKWETSGTEFRYENPGSQGTNVFVSGHGQPAATMNGTSFRLYAHMADATFPPHLPALVLATALLGSQYSLQSMGLEALANRQVLHVQTSLATDSISAQVTQQDWFFDPSTALPVRVEYRLPDNYDALRFTPAAYEFSDFRSIAGLQVPFQITVYDLHWPRQQCFGDWRYAALSRVETVSKSGDQVTIKNTQSSETKAAGYTIKIGQSVSFQVGKLHGNPALTNINGIGVKKAFLGSAVRSVEVIKREGHTFLHVSTGMGAGDVPVD